MHDIDNIKNNHIKHILNNFMHEQIKGQKP